MEISWRDQENKAWDLGCTGESRVGYFKDLGKTR